MLGGVGGSDWTASTLLMNIITCWTQSNIKRCTYTLIYDGIQHELVHTSSRVPGSWALIRFLTNSHIFPYSAHLTIIFTHIEMPLSLLLSYVYFILLCHLPLMSARLVFGIVDTGAYELTMFILPPTTTTQKHSGDAAKATFFNPGQQCDTLTALPAVLDSLYTFFFKLMFSCWKSILSCNIEASAWQVSAMHSQHGDRCKPAKFTGQIWTGQSLWTEH